MARYVCSRCGYTADTPRSVSKHISTVHDRSETAEDRYGNTSPSYDNRPRIMEDPTDDEDESPYVTFLRQLLSWRL